MKTTKAKIVLSLAGIALFCFGVAYGQTLPEIKVKHIVDTRTLTHYVDNPVEIVKFIPQVQEIIREVEVEKVLTVERIIERPVELTDFNSLEELQEFVEGCAPAEFTANADGKIYLDRQCTVNAEAMVKQAITKGKYLSYQILDYDQAKSHAVVQAWIGDSIYFIEPLTKRIWFNSYRGNTR
jgi:hypothetical protein